MPIGVQTPISAHTGNGIATVFAYAFAILSADDLKVKVAGVTVTTGFTVSGVGNRGGGTVTFSTPPASGAAVLLYREISLDRDTDYQENGDLLAGTLDDDLDRVWMALQDQGGAASRTVRAPVGETLAELPAASSRALRVLGFDAVGAPTLLTRTDDGGSALALDLANTTDATKGAGLMGLNPTLNYAAGTIGARLKSTLHVKDFPWLAKLDGVTDDSAAINACLAAAGDGGHVHIGEGEALCLSPILAEDYRGLRITGETGQFGFSGTRIIGKHTGKATLSLVGSFFCELTGISIEGETTARPDTGLLLGRSSAASAGNHTFTNVCVQGYFQTAGCYNVASEENTFINCYIVPNAAAVAGLYMSQGDGFTVGGLTGSSMECNTFIGGAIGNVDTTAGSTCIYLDCGASTGHHQFFGTFLTKHGGDSFITIRLGNTDGLDTEFPISFWNVVGEHGATQPTNGLHIISASTKRLCGLTAKNLRLQTPSTNNILCDGGGQVYLIGADISTPYRAAGNKPSTFQRVDGSRLVLLSESAITINQMLSSDLMHNTAGPTITSQDGCIVRDMSGGGFSLSEGLALAAGGTVTINGLQVLAARATGYTAMTGTANRAAVWDTSTVTLAQLAQRVKALQDDLAVVHGLIGA